jgi:hypothetical protein
VFSEQENYTRSYTRLNKSGVGHTRHGQENCRLLSQTAGATVQNYFHAAKHHDEGQFYSAAARSETPQTSKAS